MKSFFTFLVIFVALLEVVADVLFKQWAIYNKNIYIILGVLIYLVAIIFWAFSLKYQSLSKAIVIFAVINLIVDVLVGVMFFKDQLTTLNIIGILLGIVSISLL